jgi:hypothetical protein
MMRISMICFSLLSMSFITLRSPHAIYYSSFQPYDYGNPLVDRCAAFVEGLVTLSRLQG